MEDYEKIITFLSRISKLGFAFTTEGPDTIFIEIQGGISYSSNTIFELAVAIHDARPDKVSIEGGKLRLWWD